MSTETAREIERQRLLQGLLDAVKQCQKSYGGRSELATETNDSVTNLLLQFEVALLHGLKRGKMWGAITSLSEPLRQVTGKVLNNLPDIEPTFWPFIRDYLGILEVQRFLSLYHVNTDSGRARAFIRSCLNEHSLERYITSFLSNKAIIRKYYEDWALILDDEKASTLPAMARGLAPIFFAIQIDSPSLNDPLGVPRQTQSQSNFKNVASFDEPLPVIAGQLETDDIENGNHGDMRPFKKKKKRKVNTVEVSDLDYVGGIENNCSNQRKTEGIENDRQSDDAVQQTSSSSNRKKLSSGDGVTRDDLNGVDVASSSPDNNSEDYSILARAASLSTSFKRSYSSTSHDQEYLPSAEFVSKESLDDLDRENVTDNDLEDRLYQMSAVSPEMGFHLETQRSRQNVIQYETMGESLYGKTSEIATGGFRNEKLCSVTVTAEQEDAARYNAEGFLDTQSDSRQESTNASAFSPRLGQCVEKGNEDVTTDTLDVLLCGGEQLSVSEDAFERLALESQLKTPPSTPTVASTDHDKVGLRDGLQPQRQVVKDDLSELGKQLTMKLGPRIEDFVCEASSSLSNNVLVLSKNWELQDGGIREEQEEEASSGRQEDEQSITSSTTENDALEFLQPVGYDSSKFTDLIMTYDAESMKAASDTLALLNNSHHIGSVFDSRQDKENKFAEFSLEHPKDTDLEFTSRTEDGLNAGDLKQAILITARRKEEAEKQSRILQTALDEEREYALMLKGEVDRYQEQMNEIQEKSHQKIHQLSRENEVLRNQLKKYVAAVQLLRRDNKSVSSETNEVMKTLRALKDDTDIALPPEPKARSRSESDSIFEEKLAQIAEMHGELLEFNEHLQRQMIHRENQVTKMREELISLRGPLPQDLEASSISSSSGDDVAGQLGKPLINIWIPSVFMKGKGSEAYHVYQVYIRIGDEEWNIYRRYSQFFKLHSKACKQFPTLANFSFPPKKILGKKDIKFVEGRRRRLQEYLRKLINQNLASNSTLSMSPNKENLVIAEPFFGEPYSEEDKKSISTKPKKKKVSAVYTGL